MANVFEKVKKGLNLQPVAGSGVASLGDLAYNSSSNKLELFNGSTVTMITSADAGSYITSLTGDVTASGGGAAAATLATVNGNVGSFGSSTSIPNFTVNAKGLITAAGGNAVIAPAGTLSGTTLNATVVSSSLTSLGTITSGIWHGTAIGSQYGGTGQDFSASTGALSVSSGTVSAGTLSVGNGGTGASTLTANNVLLGNGTSAVQFVAPGTSGNVLTSNGTTWSSSAAASGQSAYAFYTDSSGSSLSDSTQTDWTWGTAVSDTQSIWNGTKFTAPFAGTVTIRFTLRTNSVAWTSGNIFRAEANVSGVGGTYTANSGSYYIDLWMAQASQTLSPVVGGTFIFKVATNDVIAITLFQNRGASTIIQNDANANNISIHLTSGS